MQGLVTFEDSRGTVNWSLIINILKQQFRLRYILNFSIINIYLNFSYLQIREQLDRAQAHKIKLLFDCKSITFLNQTNKSDNYCIRYYSE
jgi:hypothetical protein